MSNRKTGNYHEYERLLRKYKTRDPMERWSGESYTEESRMNRIRDYLQISEYIMDGMYLTGTQRRDVKWLIKNVPLKELHRQISIECIILCLCIYVRKSYGDNFKLKDYKIINEHKLTCNVLLVVVTNLCIWYSRRVPLPRVDNVDKHGTLVDEHKL